jgi:hypothetical protein
MLSHFGWKAALAVLVNAARARCCSARTRRLPRRPRRRVVPRGAVHWVVRGAPRVPGRVVVFAHHPAVFMGLFLFFMGFATAYPQHQDRLILREGLLVAFFLAGLVVLGGQQQWWLEPCCAAWTPTPCTSAPPR